MGRMILAQDAFDAVTLYVRTVLVIAGLVCFLLVVLLAYRRFKGSGYRQKMAELEQELIKARLDAEKKKAYKPILPPVTFEGNYSIKLDTDKPKSSDLDAPPALTPLRQDRVQPYVGLKLTRPFETK